ncbi:large ribosomal subunit protein mL49 isoform X2 [Pongo pygmaeus]|nr:39S ribosomal protein L49, mitochondrial isoform X1 [Pongo abelii]XP_054293504.1 39S ribosomal protein L49, mitochondrial isoform X2 [Pongo pygmaeus]
MAATMFRATLRGWRTGVQRGCGLRLLVRALSEKLRASRGYPPPNLPYFVRRSRMHNIPVYKDITHGNRQMTVIRKVEGDIWALQKDVEDFLSPLLGKTPVTQVNEVTGTLRIKGYFDQELKAWLLEKGF